MTREGLWKQIQRRNEPYRRIEVLEKENAELKEKNEGYCRSRDRLISIGFPTFKDCKEYAEQLAKAKEIIKTLLHISNENGLKVCDVYGAPAIIKQAEDFIKES